MKEFETILDDLKDKTKSPITELSEYEKKLILNKTLNKIGYERNYKPTHKRKIAIICTACIVSLSVVATAATVFKLNNKFMDYFSVKKIETSNYVEGEDLKVSTQNKGVSIFADQVIGDERGCYIIFHTQGNNISKLTFQNINVKIDGVETLICSDMIMTGSKDANNSSFMLHITSDKPIQGKNINITFENLGTKTYDNVKQEYKFENIKNGTWDLSWKLNYTGKEKKIDVNKDISIYEGKAVWNNISISPVSATVALTETKTFEKYTDNANDTLVVELLDGTIIRSDYADSSDVLNNTTSISLYFHKIISYKDIESITFAGEKVVLNENPNPMKYTFYANDNMGISIDMPTRLYEIVTPISQEKMDNDVGVSVKSVSFEGEKNEVKATLFTVYAYKGGFSPEEIEHKKPMEKYLSYKNGYTYTISYGKLDSNDQKIQFENTFNQDVLKIKERIEIMN